MSAFKVVATCSSGHSSSIIHEGMTREGVELFAGILDGTSPAFMFPPGPESVIGKCCWADPAYPNHHCGKPFKCTIEEVTG